MNNLDNKVIVDRETLQYLLDWTSSALGNTDISTLSAHHYGEGEKHVAAAERSLAADLTGWVAVPVRPTMDQTVEGETVLVPRADNIYRAMLAASPPLPQEGE